MIESSDFFNLVEKECIDTYFGGVSQTNYKIKCFYECQAPFIHKCGNKKCAKNETECKYYLELENLMRMLNPKISSRFLVSSNEKPAKFKFKIDAAYKSLVNKIINCLKISYAWDPNDFCISGRNCYTKVLKNRLRRTECPCNKKNLTFVCDGNFYCARNKKACDFFVSKHFISFSYQMSRLNDIQKCENDFILNKI